jgi:hypothetical protein
MNSGRARRSAGSPRYSLGAWELQQVALARRVGGRFCVVLSPPLGLRIA